MYGLIGKITSINGKRNELVNILTAISTQLPNCLSYIVQTDTKNETDIWVSEVWISKEDHAHSLTLEPVLEALKNAKPLIASVERLSETTPQSLQFSHAHLHNSIDYIELPMSNFDTAKAFYKKVFNWSFIDYGNDYCAFIDQKLEGGFYRSEQKSTTESGAILPVFYSKNLEDTQEKVISAGGTISKAIFSFPGGRRFQFLDPHGNEWAVWAKPKV